MNKVICKKLKNKHQVESNKTIYSVSLNLKLRPLLQNLPHFIPHFLKKFAKAQKFLTQEKAKINTCQLSRLMFIHLSFIRTVWINERDSWITEAREALIILKSDLLVSSVQT